MCSQLVSKCQWIISTAATSMKMVPDNTMTFIGIMVEQIHSDKFCKCGDIVSVQNLHYQTLN